jgi:hypothetical protein
MFNDWAFAADILATTVSTEFSVLFAQTLTARFGDLTNARHLLLRSLRLHGSAGQQHWQGWGLSCGVDRRHM